MTPREHDAAPVLRLRAQQRTTLSLVGRGWISTSMLGCVRSLVKRGLVDDLGLYDRENHTKRYGADRYKINAQGQEALDAAS